MKGRCNDLAGQAYRLFFGRLIAVGLSVFIPALNLYFLSYQFQYYYFLWLLASLVVLVALFFLLLRWKRKVSRRIGDQALVKELISSYSPFRFGARFSLLSLAFAAGVLAAMNLRKPGGPDGINRKGIDVVIALDLSRSMLATDLAPSRLDRAKQFISRLMNEIPDDRIALVFFAGKAYLQMPLTGDHGAAQLFVSTADPAAIPQQGTVISDALKMSNTAFGASEARYKAVVLISDGEDHDEQAVSLARNLATHGLMINTVGIGSPQGSYIPDPATGDYKRDENGNPVLSRLNEEELKQISGLTNGVYVRLQQTDEAVKAVVAQLSQIETKVTGDISLMNFRTYYWWFAGAMLALLLAELFIPERKKATA